MGTDFEKGPKNAITRKKMDAWTAKLIKLIGGPARKMIKCFQPVSSRSVEMELRKGLRNAIISKKMDVWIVQLINLMAGIVGKIRSYFLLVTSAGMAKEK